MKFRPSNVCVRFAFGKFGIYGDEIQNFRTFDLLVVLKQGLVSFGVFEKLKSFKGASLLLFTRKHISTMDFGEYLKKSGG